MNSTDMTADDLHKLMKFMVGIEKELKYFKHFQDMDDAEFMEAKTIFNKYITMVKERMEITGI